jgi:hypothetical protein
MRGVQNASGPLFRGRNAAHDQLASDLSAR